MKSFRKHLTYANVMSSLAVFLMLGSGAAIAAGGLGKNTVGSKQLKKNAVTAVKVKDGSLLGADFAAGQLPAGATGPAGAKGATGAAGPAGVVGPNSVTSASVLDDTAPGGGLNTQDINQLNGDADIVDNTITTFDIATNAIDSDEVLDFGLSNEDIGVLFAQINAAGTVASSSGGVTSSKISTGQYEVDYGRDVSSCAFVTTQGEATPGGAAGAIIGNTDRSGDANATFVTTRDAAGTLIDTSFQQIVVC
jgi:hypothetical protein